MKLTDYIDLGGTIRSRNPEQTIAFLEPLLARLGITRVADVTGLDCIGIPVAVSIRPNSKHLTTSQGKGITWELAYISAVMESIEGYHAENPPPPAIQGAYNQLIRRYPMIGLDLLNTGFFQIAAIADKTIDWIECINLIDDKTYYLPHALICLDTTQPHFEYGFLAINTNGLSAGNTLDEAICHALYEIIERDALARWAVLDQKIKDTSQINLASIDSSLNRSLLEKIINANNNIKIWDITSSIGIPAFHCSIQDKNALRKLDSFRGTGAHLSCDIALSRAITEAVQSRLTIISGSRDDLFPEYYQNVKTYNNYHEQIGVKLYSNCIRPLFHKSFEDNKNELLTLLSQQGFKQVLMVNHTKNDFELPVVHIFIPGMQYSGRRV